MTVGELKRKLQVYNDNVDVIPASDCIHGTSINLNLYKLWGEYYVWMESGRFKAA